MVYGGILPRRIVEPSVVVSVSWWDSAKGIVMWAFRNMSKETKIVALYRGYTYNNQVFAYYFGDAYYPIYLNYPQYFNTRFITKIEPLEGMDPETNSPPYGILRFKNGKLVPAFVFVLGPEEAWAMLEGGFTNNIYPTVYRAVELTPAENSPQQVCVGYPEQAVIDWDQQTGTMMAGYTPNPKTFESIVFNVEENAPYVSLWGSKYYKLGKCGHVCKHLRLT